VILKGSRVNKKVVPNLSDLNQSFVDEILKIGSVFFKDNA